MRSIVLGATAVLGAVSLTACGSNAKPAAQPDPVTSPVANVVKEASTAAATKAKPKPKPKKTPTSDVRQLVRLGITINEGVLIDVADDGVNRWLQVGKGGVVDFTGTKRLDSTMMSLKPAPVKGRNKVLIKPPFWNEDLGAGYCVADTKGAALKLEVCRTGRTQQVFTVVPAGDSGQFELRGTYGIIRVDNGKITTSGQGRTGLQTIKYAS
ncbi:hypothetical protein JIG36_41940 [Actinoplanes sp. LDG1-06]|uniref:Uncharacterized protein n=1 Tax=Paractinoplanes ovalisporus TaxID=2810368 RepID=A0ABS2AQI6_9ACTN|nr:hypothetical protein [Actinoplanes ovalisporus]MBM2622085.1 hypothetical protein [Actinoplanes ovalisporus]